MLPCLCLYASAKACFQNKMKSEVKKRKHVNRFWGYICEKRIEWRIIWFQVLLWKENGLYWKFDIFRYSHFRSFLDWFFQFGFYKRMLSLIALRKSLPVLWFIITEFFFFLSRPQRLLEFSPEHCFLVRLSSKWVGLTVLLLGMASQIFIDSNLMLWGKLNAFI